MVSGVVGITYNDKKLVGSNSAKLIITDGRIIFRTNLPPKSVDYTINGVKYQEIERPDLAPITTINGYNLRRMSMVVFVGSPRDYETDINGELGKLTDLSRSLSVLSVEYDLQTVGDWNMTGLNFTSTERQNGTNQITRADVTMEFTESVGFGTSNLITSPISSSSKPIYYTTQKGDTYVSIAKKFHIAKWQTIADLNLSIPQNFKPNTKIRVK